MMMTSRSNTLLVFIAALVLALTSSTSLVAAQEPVTTITIEESRPSNSQRRELWSFWSLLNLRKSYSRNGRRIIRSVCLLMHPNRLPFPPLLMTF